MASVGMGSSPSGASPAPVSGFCLPVPTESSRTASAPHLAAAIGTAPRNDDCAVHDGDGGGDGAVRRGRRAANSDRVDVSVARRDEANLLARAGGVRAATAPRARLWHRLRVYPIKEGSAGQEALGYAS
eukprot:5980123-Pleurochrysis_carterae.AAC.1